MNRCFPLLFVLVTLLAGCATQQGMRQLTVTEKDNLDHVVALFAPEEIEKRVRHELTTEYLKNLLAETKLSDDHMRVAVQAYENVVGEMFRTMLFAGLEEAFTSEMDNTALEDTRRWLETASGREFAQTMRNGITTVFDRFNLALSNADRFDDYARDTGLSVNDSLSPQARADMTNFFYSSSGQQFVNGIRKLEPVMEKHAGKHTEETLKRDFIRRFEQLLGENGLLQDEG